jgi:hypothetical protein
MNYIFRGIYSILGYEYKIGLWQSCETILNLGQQCFNINCPQGDTTIFCSKILAARVFVTLACIISAISALLLFATAVTNDNIRRILLMAGKGLAFACLIIGTIGVAVGINVATDTGLQTNLTWGASSIIGIVAIVLNFCGAIASVLIK